MPNSYERSNHSEASSREKLAGETLKSTHPSVGRRWVQLVRAPSVFHSAMYGMAAGVVFYGGYIAWRAFKLDNCNTEYFARQSRWRHFEKQQLYQRELGQKMNSHFVASVAQEYDPVALRKPDSQLDPKHIF